MTLDETIEYEEETADEEALQILDWLKVLKNIQSTGDCNVCKKEGIANMNQTQVRWFGIIVLFIRKKV